ncbi:MAG: hypothetical protein ACK5KP_05615 [Paludibacteraceae bacterium]
MLVHFGNSVISKKNKYGIHTYTSLSNLLKKYKFENDEIWDIIEIQGKVLFQSFKSIFIYDGHTIEGKTYDETFLLIHRFNNQLYTHTLQYGFCRFDIDEKKFEKVENVPFKSAVISVVPFNQSKAYLVTQSDGIHTFDGKLFGKFSDSNLDNLRNSGVNKAILSRDSLLIVEPYSTG